ncbi:proteasome subunit beta [Ascobolus immersus RN42]|uniref:Proteasome subunit beta n=1 Tax=Ascobolus immersus RN42 TaxID=1160509 RepID=A0A3N4ISX8_ASCIM|nr:proteasome subunit beta [Ascobolus immersus RN42]
MNHFPEGWGRPRDDVYGAYDGSHLKTVQPGAGFNQHTQSPIVTGTSVIAVKYKDGVVIAADTLASYGSLARFRDVERLKVVGEKTVVGAGGDMSDMQYIFDDVLERLMIKESYSPESHSPLLAPHVYTYLSRLLYARRSRLNPLWNALLVAGHDEHDKPFLASVDLLGTTFDGPALATGFGAHLALPLLRKLVPNEEASQNVTKEQATEAVKAAMKVLFYRDARSIDEYSIAWVTPQGVEQSREKLENQSWKFAERIRGYGTQTN